MPTALIVEDEPEANKLLSMLVQLRGYQTDSALNGRDALAIVEQRPPDIIFLDLMLPDINGYEVCTQLKSRKKTTMIPVVMVTARVTLENRIQSFTLGADQYVPKPYTPDQIFDALDDANDWRVSVANDQSDMTIAINSADDGETLRRLARLRSLLLATTPLDTATVVKMATSLQKLAIDADLWGQKHGLQEIALLDYHHERDHVVLSVRDVSGWFRDEKRILDELWTQTNTLGQFDSIARESSQGSLVFIKSFSS